MSRIQKGPTVYVTPKVAKKVMKVDDELAELGVGVEYGRVAYKSSGFFEAVKTAWLLYGIAKEARGNWPAIRRLLLGAGLTRYEITTLGLSDYTRTTKRKVKRKTK
jgi:hypothetical protein